MKINDIERTDHVIESDTFPNGHLVEVKLLADGTFACRHLDGQGELVASANFPAPPDRHVGAAGQAFLWRDAEAYRITGPAPGSILATISGDSE